MIASVFYLAAASLPSVEISNDQIGLVMLIGGATILVNIIGGIVGIWAAVRRQPPISQELQAIRKECAEMFATKNDLASIAKEISDLRSERRADLKELRMDVGELRTLFEQGFKEMQRALGRVEGKLGQ